MNYEDLKIGQKVIVIKPFMSHEGGWNNEWVDSMFSYIVDNKIYTIAHFSNKGVEFNEDDNFKFPWQSLKLVELDQDTTESKEINTMTTQVSVFRKNLNPIYGEGTTHIRIEDEAAGPFIILSQDDQEIRLDEDEIQIVADAALKLLNDSKIYFKEN